MLMFDLGKVGSTPVLATKAVPCRAPSVMLGEYWIYALAVVILIATLTLLYSHNGQWATSLMVIVGRMGRLSLKDRPHSETRAKFLIDNRDRNARCCSYLRSTSDQRECCPYP
jgi:hypothetical protein